MVGTVFSGETATAGIQKWSIGRKTAPHSQPMIILFIGFELPSNWVDPSFGSLQILLTNWPKLKRDIDKDSQ